MLKLIPYLEDFRGESGGGTITVADGETRRLPNEPCKFVILFNWTVRDTSELTSPIASAASSLPASAATGTEIYYGFNGVICAQLFAGYGTELLPVSNLNQISVRQPSGKTAIVRYAWFK